MMTSGQMRAARALLGIDQRGLAGLSGLSLPTIKRMEASAGVVRGNVDSLMKLIGALRAAGIELIDAGVVSAAGDRGVRLTGSATLSPREPWAPGSPRRSPRGSSAGRSARA